VWAASAARWAPCKPAMGAGPQEGEKGEKGAVGWA
jgi:hypothetical protein